VSVELLVERTEGWPAWVYLAALWLRVRSSPSAAAGGRVGWQARPAYRWMQRKPMWLVEVSIASGWRAAGR
jgi:hypothetical protein